jgi:hypothetical protein
MTLFDSTPPSSHVMSRQTLAIISITTMMGLSVRTVRRVVHEGRPQDVPAMDGKHPMRPSSKERIECQLAAARELCLPPRPM